MDYSKLQNGSDIRGVALEGIEGQHINLTEQACKDIGRGFALWLIKKTGRTDLRVAVGRDSRLSGEALSGWLCEAMVEEGLEVTDFGMASTPAMFMTTQLLGCDGAIQLTASHHPFNIPDEYKDVFKEEDGHLYAIYGTPAESLTGLQVQQFRAKFGIIENTMTSANSSDKNRFSTL